MWDWANRHWWCCFVPETLQKNPNQSLLLTTHNDVVYSNCISFSAVARMFASWLNRRRRRYLLLIICSPVLIPLIFATCPFICAAEIWWFLCRKRRRWAGAGAGDCRTRAGDGGGDEVGLMQRYLEDQLMLVVGSVYECGDGDGDMEDHDGVDVEYLDSARPLLQ
ncbi:hypothetical protein PHJA_000281800 [Phtheirospermum japonicum]|uniref:Uncharacterized protein n=1 Tax=Phtheirospermum japonicum TaxID=374723 RepID=A0A830BBK2_9LAMI|nr:hypothetical protein PHJA_000281800 [Phtheirospermum japonicum]